MMEAESAVRVDLGQSNHAVPTEVRTCLAHLIGRDGVVAGFTGRVGDREGRDDGHVAKAISVEECDPLDTGPLASELVEERLPDGVRQDEVHRDRCSEEGGEPRRGGSGLRRRCADPAATSGSPSGNGSTCSTRRSC